MHKSILIAEDDINLAHVLGEAIDTVSDQINLRAIVIYPVSWFDEAIQVNCRWRIDLMIVDEELQGNRNGMDLIKLLNSTSLHMAKVLITGDNGGIKDHPYSKDCGIDAIIEKPFKIRKLKKVLRKVMSLLVSGQSIGQLWSGSDQAN